MADLRAAVAAERGAGRTIGFVPTMGALHDGHLALVDAARANSDCVVASIFVNRKQFGPNEDFDAYPRQEREDAAKLETRGAALLFAPPHEEMYPDGFATTVSVGGLDEVLCGASRPGHFDGVATVVTKLLNQAAPDIACFGEKDWQQLTIIRRLVRDLDLPVRIVGVPIEREDDGLARSSRNAYLSEAERTVASRLPNILHMAADRIGSGGDPEVVLSNARRELEEAGFTVDYLDLRNENDLSPVRAAGRGARLFAAAWLGRPRLIDNLPVPARRPGL